jgi:C5HC2 zinc finger
MKQQQTIYDGSSSGTAICSITTTTTTAKQNSTTTTKTTKDCYNTCQMLLNEIKRVMNEEMTQRTKLLSLGVRDVSHLTHLRDQSIDFDDQNNNDNNNTSIIIIDEACVNYDDQRTCHYCKYICYYSAVACQCSQSKVSCLRHSHFMRTSSYNCRLDFLFISHIVYVIIPNML